MDERRWAAIWHGDRLPDAGHVNGVDIFVLEIVKKDILQTEKGGRGSWEDNVLFPIGEIIEDRLAW